MERRVQPPTTSIVYGTVSDSIPALPIVESSTTLSQRDSYVPPSSTLSSDPELNNALPVLLDNEKSSNLLSQEVSQSTSMRVDTLQSSTSTTVSDSLSIENSSTTLSLSNSCVLPSSTYSSDPDLNDASTSDVKCSQENCETSDGMDPYTFDLFFPVIPLSQTTDLLPQGTSQFASKDQGVDIFQPSKPTAHSHHSNLDMSSPPPSTYSSPKLPSDNSKNSSREKMTEWICPFDLFSVIPLPESVTGDVSACVNEAEATSTSCGTASDHLPALPIVETNPQSNSCVAPSPTYNSDPELNDVLRALCDDENCGQESRETSDGMEPYIFDLLLQIPLIPLPQTTDLPPQESSQSASKEQGVDTLQPISSTAHSQPSSLDSSYTIEEMMEPIFDLFSLIPLPLTTDLLPQESSQSASKEQEVDTLQPISSTAHSQPSSLDSSCTTEKMVPEMEPIFDLFSLIPLPQTTNPPPQESSQSASKEQRVDILQPITSNAPPHHLPVDQTTNTEREMGTPSPCAQCSHSSVHEDENNSSVCMHTNSDPSQCLDERIQATLGEQSITSSFSSASPSTETASHMEAGSNVEAQNCTNKKGKTKKVLSVIQQQRQRILNKVSALHYRRRKKERMSDLEVRKEQLEAENTRLKEKVSVLTTEIAKLKRLSKTQKAKFCPFFLHSTCNKIK